MTFLQFFDEWNGKFCDYDKAFGFQCMDLVRQYIKEVLGWKPYEVIPPVNYAKEAFYNYNKSKFTRIENSKTNFPKEGDIVIWKWWWPITGVAGHIAICSKADVKTMITFDQNYPSKQPCKFVNHSYSGVLGWLRPIK